MNKILIIAGEASGDLLGADLSKALQEASPEALDIYGIGGEHMAQAGVRLLSRCEEIAVVGGTEIIKHFKQIRKAYKQIKETLISTRPDLVILIDYPGFNLRIAKLAKKQGLKVFFYVSPQIWAWRYYRIHHIKKYVDHMAVLFSFEEKIYQKESIPVSFVGHPITELASATKSRDELIKQYDLQKNHPIIGILPGSRHQEIERHLSLMVEGLKLIRKKIPNAQFILPLAQTMNEETMKLKLSSIFKAQNEQAFHITIISSDSYNAMSLMDAAIAVSGTVTLELALMKIPMVVVYRLSQLTFSLAKRFIKLPYISLCNIVGEDFIAKELVQHDATPEAIANETIELIENKNYRETILKKYDIVSKNAGEKGASKKAATAALELINQSS